MAKTLVALVALAAGAIAADSAAVELGATFDVADDARADALIADGSAKVAEGEDVAAPPAQPKPTGKVTKARVLVDCPHGKPNEVVKLGAAELKEALAAGWVDADKEAVAFAESQATKA